MKFQNMVLLFLLVSRFLFAQTSFYQVLENGTISYPKTINDKESIYVYKGEIIDFTKVGEDYITHYFTDFGEIKLSLKELDDKNLKKIEIDNKRLSSKGWEIILAEENKVMLSCKSKLPDQLAVKILSVKGSLENSENLEFNSKRPTNEVTIDIRIIDYLIVIDEDQDNVSLRIPFQKIKELKEIVIKNSKELNDKGISVNQNIIFSKNIVPFSIEIFDSAYNINKENFSVTSNILKLLNIDNIKSTSITIKIKYSKTDQGVDIVKVFNLPVATISSGKWIYIIIFIIIMSFFVFYILKKKEIIFKNKDKKPSDEQTDKGAKTVPENPNDEPGDQKNGNKTPDTSYGMLNSSYEENNNESILSSIDKIIEAVENVTKSLRSLKSQLSKYKFKDMVKFEKEINDLKEEKTKLNNQLEEKKDDNTKLEVENQNLKNTNCEKEQILKTTLQFFHEINYQQAEENKYNKINELKNKILSFNNSIDNLEKIKNQCFTYFNYSFKLTERLIANYSYNIQGNKIFLSQLSDKQKFDSIDELHSLISKELVKDLAKIVPGIKRIEFILQYSNLKESQSSLFEKYCTVITEFNEIMGIIEKNFTIKYFDLKFGQIFKNIDEKHPDKLKMNSTLRVNDYYPGVKFKEIADETIIDATTWIIYKEDVSAASDRIHVIIHNAKS